MKKRSMLAIASLATGFVVAAVTPSHAVGDGLGPISVDETLKTLNQTVAKDGLPVAKKSGAKKIVKKDVRRKG